MGKTEVIILIFVVLFVGAFIIIYLENSKKIKAEKESQTEKPADKPAEKKSEPPKTEAKSEKKEAKKDEKSEKAEQKKLEKAQEEAEKELRSVMEDISIKSENYIKSLEAKDEQTSKKSKFEMKEVSEYEVQRDEAAEEAAIILGVKQKRVHVFDDFDDCYDNTHETKSSILTDMNQEELEENKSKNSPYSQVDIDNFEEDESVAEEFANLSKRMKVMMMTDVFKRKSDNENQE